MPIPAHPSRTALLAISALHFLQRLLTVFHVLHRVLLLLFQVATCRAAFGALPERAQRWKPAPVFQDCLRFRC